MLKRSEPEILRRGKLFHKLIQKEWKDEAEGAPHSEKKVPFKGKRYGRIDIYVDEIGESLVSIVEVKSTDWDKIKSSNIRRNVRRQIRQIWRYIDSISELKGMDISAGIIFPRLPSDHERLNLIESMFVEEGIQVVWHNETKAECKLRNQGEVRDEI